MLTHRCEPEAGSEWFKPILTSDSKHKDQQNLLLIITRCDHYEKKGKLRANAMKCVAAGRPSLDSLAFEPMKRPDDRADYCLIMTFLVIFCSFILPKMRAKGIARSRVYFIGLGQHVWFTHWRHCLYFHNGGESQIYSAIAYLFANHYIFAPALPARSNGDVLV